MQAIIGCFLILALASAFVIKGLRDEVKRLNESCLITKPGR